MGGAASMRRVHVVEIIKRYACYDVDEDTDEAATETLEHDAIYREPIDSDTLDILSLTVTSVETVQ
jgi:hypothetical protein